MEPTSFNEENRVLGPPNGVSEEKVPSLSVFTDGEVVISCWKVTKAELEEITKTGRIWLRVMGATMPPVWLSGTNPF